MNNNKTDPIPHKKASRIWIVVADSRIARVFTKNGHGPEGFGEITPTLRKIPDFTNKTVGRVGASARGGPHHKYEPHMNESCKDKLAFAQEIADWLDDHSLNNQFDRIILVAAPRTLGDLRKALSAPVRNRIVAEVNKELTGLDDAVLRKTLSEIVWF